MKPLPTLFPLHPPSTPPGSLWPELFPVWHEVCAEWDRQGRTYTQQEALEEVARRAEDRRTRQDKRQVIPNEIGD